MKRKALRRLVEARGREAATSRRELDLALHAAHARLARSNPYLLIGTGAAAGFALGLTGWMPHPRSYRMLLGPLLPFT